MTLNEVMQELESMGNENTKKVLLKHGAREPFFGVKVADLKKIVKKVKKNHELSLELYATGNSDAMYLAGLIADEKQIAKETLEEWAKKAGWSMIAEYTVPWIASESPHGMELGLKWIESDDEMVCACGWSTLANVTTITPDAQLDIDKFSALLDRAAAVQSEERQRVRYTMNGFLITVGCSVEALKEKALNLGTDVGKVKVDMGGTACKVPVITDYIKKVEKMGRIGKKKKMARC